MPFDEPADMMKKRGISVPSGLAAGAPVFNSAEETTYESTQQGGTNCIIFPVPRDQQTRKRLTHTSILRTLLKNI